ncbi:MAG: hypothetical protein A3C43_02480 [Candidatus Schekmanbacteria bacterium RIFCSPHIGHO2_02_FULL_38_11]|uniref:PTS EIIA type-4 domain-containing protein n=1 Tax=Candidatus Schekmanbacteria bacterium RIFCSPLOWO2_12_FULL_38_15 TaxID=1817883 RepID=A0A1F7SMT0_9BACT|nr:MAG: hypothetical protein A2043_08980 [Candidatus Schekmanbacteria bacterium GWA2_38_9]OGL48699.1 MAG: hypothetical protein A3C43_02480 [Candidatus Schekmanbacteria bacterium RIFCSPHIGHO2_02_FULL_38_11]OGL51085.1 MAG: hypothetical protein A3H37_08645 [Candidatus Schekmanbacteria bacterium RIFCSPLOWO2_02_FULL_38_14]OGL55085.1 MAG: hypothetical protein A3G31_02470 [Candidatus Schekmanbacteria bacterium RIFCSPLOWO2_12_FULL_38_15]
MVGAVIVTHGNLGDEIVKSAETIIGVQKKLKSVVIKHEDSEATVRENISKAISEVDDGDGILIFTDMFGGTPSNLSLCFLEENRVEVVTGINLPMLIKFSSERKKAPLPELAAIIKEYGQKHILVASQILQKNKSGL